MLNRIQQDNSVYRLLSYKEYLKLAMNAELRSNIYPTTVLKYGRNLSSNFPSVHLNSMEVPLIHPCMAVPRRKQGFFPSGLANYYYGSDSSHSFPYPHTNYQVNHPVIPEVDPPAGNFIHLVDQQMAII